MDDQKKSKEPTDWDRITAVCAVVIALIALIFSVLEMRQNSYDRRLQLLPRIDFSAGANEEDGVFLKVRSSGLGPAVIKWFKVYVDEQEVNSWDAMYIGLGLKNEKLDSYSMIYPEDLLKADTDRFLLKELEKDLMAPLWKSIRRIGLLACYCSLYNECKVANTGFSTSFNADFLLKISNSCSATNEYPITFGVSYRVMGMN